MKRALTLCLISILVIWPSYMSLCAPQHHIQKKLKYHWLIFSQDGKQIPFLIDIHEGAHSIGFWLTYADAQGNYIKWLDRNGTGPLFTFVDGQLLSLTDSAGYMPLHQLPDLKQPGDSVFFLFYSPTGEVPYQAILCRPIKTPPTQAKANALTYQPRDIDKGTNRNILIALLLITVLLPLIVIGARQTPHQVLTRPLIVYPDNYMVQFTKKGNVLVFKYLILNAVLIGVVRYVIDVASTPSIGLIFSTIFIVFLVFFAKFIILLFADILFSGKGRYRHHFLEFQKWVCLLSLSVLFMLLLSKAGYSLEWWLEMQKIKFIGLVLGLFLIFNVYRLINYKNRFSRLFFISYICITEIIPLTVIYKIYSEVIM